MRLVGGCLCVCDARGLIGTRCGRLVLSMPRVVIIRGARSLRVGGVFSQLLGGGADYNCLPF